MESYLVMYMGNFTVLHLLCVHTGTNPQHLIPCNNALNISLLQTHIFLPPQISVDVTNLCI
jgi:hypothetical protein